MSRARSDLIDLCLDILRKTAGDMTDAELYRYAHIRFIAAYDQIAAEPPISAADAVSEVMDRIRRELAERN